MLHKFLLPSLFLLTSLLSADEMTDLDLGGFEDDSTELIQTTPIMQEPEAQSSYTIGGNIAFKRSYGYRKHSVSGVDYSGFNQEQTALFLELDTRVFSNWKIHISGDAFYDTIYDRFRQRDYSSEVLRDYKSQLRLGDTFIEGELYKNLDVKVGRQIVVWGKSDSIRVTDVINPLDNRLPALTDIEDLRLPTTMAKIDYYYDDWNFSAMAIAESRIFYEATPRGEFFPVEEIFPSAPDPFIALIKPESSFEQMQYAFAANGIFSGWDLSFYTANVLDSKWFINPNTSKREVKKITMIGSAINIAYGSWLLKSEVAYLSGIRYNSTQDEKSRLDTLVGFDYMGVKDTVISLELVNRHIYEYESQMSRKVASPDFIYEDEQQTAFRVSHSLSNETINLNALVNLYGQRFEYGGFGRLWIDIELTDGLNATIGVIDYIDGDKPFIDSISNNDRVFADLTYSF